MRTIKFRFWSNADKEMKDWKWCLANLELGDVESKNMMQYIELKDKNGKEIYEGDIVKTAGSISVVKWGQHLLGYTLAHGASEFPMADDDLLEVIGNVHENPELLTNL